MIAKATNKRAKDVVLEQSVVPMELQPQLHMAL